jgi:hypothetical protein
VSPAARPVGSALRACNATHDGSVSTPRATAAWQPTSSTRGRTPTCG